jgi:hypothetical protein
MANLVELSNQLEDFPEQQLVQMSQDPNSMYPSYLVLSEIQRRNQMRKMYEAQQPKPQTTVAEEVIGEFAGQQGLQGAMAQSPGPQDAFPPSDMGNMAPPSPMQAMASGGRTGYQVGGFTPTAENPYPTAYDTSTPVSSGLSGTELVSETFTESPQTKFGAAGQKIFELGSDVANWAMENPADAAITGLMFVPGIGWAGSLGLKAISAISKASKGKNLVKSAFMKPGSPGYTAITGEGVKKVVPKVADKYSPLRTQATSLGIFGGKEVYDYGMSPAEEQPKPLTEDERIAKKVAEEMAKFKSKKDINTEIIDIDKVEDSKKGLSNFLPNADPTALIGLGGAIMQANTVGELGKGISEVAVGERARKDALSLNDLKTRLTEAQITKYEADIAGMPVKQLEFALEQLDSQIKEGSFGSEDERQEALKQYNQLLNAYLAKTGFSSVAQKNQRNELLGLVEELG